MQKPLSKQAKPRGRYRAAEDTFLLAEVLSKYRSRQSLEIGVGEGVVTAALAEMSGRVVATDIDIEAIRKTSERLGYTGLIDKVDLLLCDGAKPLSCEFDLCTFNPPIFPMT